MQRLLVCIWAAAAALAQVVDVATNGDGSQVFLSTAAPYSSPEGPVSHSNLFRLTDRRLLQLSSETCIFVRLQGACGIASLQVGGGSKVVYQSSIPCMGGSSCLFRENSRATLIAGAKREAYSGRIRISRNGRYVVNHNTSSAPGNAGGFSRIHDLQTGARFEVGFNLRTANAVSDDGTALTDSGWLVRPEARVQLPLPENTAAIELDRDAQFVVAQAYLPRRRLHIIDVRARRTWQLGPDDRESYAPEVSAEGRWVLYTTVLGDTPQVMFSSIDGATWRQLTFLQEGVKLSALSQDGRVAIAVTNRDELLRIDTATGATEQLAASIPTLLRRPKILVPGSSYELTGSGLIGEPSGVHVTLDGTRMELLSVSPARIVFQVPWETRAASGDLLLHRGNHELELMMPAVAAEIAPEIVAVLREDFRFQVPSNGAVRPGEIVHIYATGLGPVEPPLPTGAPAPVESQFHVAPGWTFTWLRGDIPAEILFIGLAPGIVGLYQIDVRTPPGMTSFPGMRGTYRGQSYNLILPPSC